MVNIENYNTKLFEIVHITDIDRSEILKFRVEKGFGLQNYFHKYALADEISGSARTYVILDTYSKTIVAYFSLRTGLITVSRGIFQGFDAHTGVEISNFAVNSVYRQTSDVIPKLGSYLFYQFILPLVSDISKYVGVEYLYIYALPEDKLINHYKTLGFSTVPFAAEKFIYRHVKPVYDKSCRFMMQKINHI